MKRPLETRERVVGIYVNIYKEFGVEKAEEWFKGYIGGKRKALEFEHNGNGEYMASRLEDSVRAIMGRD